MVVVTGGQKAVSVRENKLRKERPFSPADLKLYLDSPFASWMEQLHRTQPDPAIAPDFIATGYGTIDNEDPTRNQAFVKQLISAGNQVVVISHKDHQPARQLKTINAMRAGAHFIFNANLSVLPLVGRIDILVHTPGRSRLGDFGYLPAQFFYEDPALTDMPVELCCFVDMLEHLQGLRPAEILQITDPNSDSPHISRLPSEPYMFDYRKLKIGYRQSQMNFNPQVMPDPAESRHWGRWSRYARKLLTSQSRRTPAA
jgi:hypothetical protein